MNWIFFILKEAISNNLANSWIRFFPRHRAYRCTNKKCCRGHWIPVFVNSTLSYHSVETLKSLLNSLVRAVRDNDYLCLAKKCFRNLYILKEKRNPYFSKFWKPYCIFFVFRKATFFDEFTYFTLVLLKSTKDMV